MGARRGIGEALATPATFEGNVVESSWVPLCSSFMIPASFYVGVKQPQEARGRFCNSWNLSQTNSESLQLISCEQPGASAGSRSQSLQVSEKFQAAWGSTRAQTADILVLVYKSTKRGRTRRRTTMTTMTTQQVQNRKKQPSLAFRTRPCLGITSRQNAKALAAPKHEPWGRALRDLHCDTPPMLSDHPI